MLVLAVRAGDEPMDLVGLKESKSVLTVYASCEESVSVNSRLSEKVSPVCRGISVNFCFTCNASYIKVLSRISLRFLNKKL